MKKKILVTGVSGLLGSNIVVCLRDCFDIYGTYHHNLIEIPGVETLKVDIGILSEVTKVIRTIDPDIVLHCAAQADVDFCERNKEIAQKVNVEGTRNILEALKGLHSKYIYISTDLVYGGEKGNNAETDEVSPLNHYGKTKREAEKLSLARENALILRTNFFGWNVRSKRSIGEWVIDELLKKNPMNGFKDVYFSSIYTFELAKLLKEAIRRDIAGIYNLGSSTSLSKYCFAKMIGEKLQLDVQQINPISVEDFSLVAKRAKNLSLDISKLEKTLQLKIPTMEESIEKFVTDYLDGYSSKFKFYIKTKNVYPTLDVIAYGRQSIVDEDIEAVDDVLRSSYLTQGPKIEEFEETLAKSVDACYAVAVNSGTSALHLACMAAGVQAGDEVITSPNTFVASANCVAYCGGKPVFADIDAKTYNISPEKIKERITKKTKAIIPVHFAGQSCDMKEIQRIVVAAEKRFGNKIYIIEDASHALGSIYCDAKVGSCAFSDFTIFSFHPVKHITTGEGGAVTLNDEKIKHRLKRFRSHGITSTDEDFIYKESAFMNTRESGKSLRNPWYYEQQYLGFNYRITDIQCALGVSQFKKLAQYIQRRREIVEYYNKVFKNLKHVTIPYESKGCQSNFHLYVLLFDFDQLGITRAEFISDLRNRGIYTQVHYIPVHTQPFYQTQYATKWGDFPFAEQYYARCLSIPLSPSMTEKDVNKVVFEIKDILGVK